MSSSVSSARQFNIVSAFLRIGEARCDITGDGAGSIWQGIFRPLAFSKAATISMTLQPWPVPQVDHFHAGM